MSIGQFCTQEQMLDIKSIIDARNEREIEDCGIAGISYDVKYLATKPGYSEPMSRTESMAYAVYIYFIRKPESKIFSTGDNCLCLIPADKMTDEEFDKFVSDILSSEKNSEIKFSKF